MLVHVCLAALHTCMYAIVDTTDHRLHATPPLQDLLGLSSTQELLAVQAPILLQPRDTPASRILQDLLTRLRLDRCAYMRLRVAKKGDPYEPIFLNLLLEDRSQSGVSYVEYLCHVHRQIQQKMT